MITYYSLQKNVVDRGLGGWTHVIGVASTLSKYQHTRLVLHSTTERHQIKSKDISYSILPKKLYLSRIALDIILDRSSATSIYRKSLLGMYAVVFPILLSRLVNNRKHIIEVNGLSSEFRRSHPLLTRALKILNALPMTIFDRIYVVNNHLKSELVGTIPFSNGKFLVCPNGGPDALSPPYSTQNYEKTNFVYFGSNLDAYHLEEVVAVINQLTENNSSIHLHLIGPSMEKFHGRHVTAHGYQSLIRFRETICGMDGKLFGLIPLNEVKNATDVEPIKLFDYLSCGIPVMFSEHVLRNIGYSKDIGVRYQMDQSSDLKRALEECAGMTEENFTRTTNNVRDVYKTLTWDSRLSELTTYTRNSALNHK